MRRWRCGCNGKEEEEVEEGEEKVGVDAMGRMEGVVDKMGRKAEVEG